MTHLPPAFIAQVRAQLGADAAPFLATYDAPPTHGLRINPAKIDLPTLRTLTGWNLEPIPWCPSGAYIDPDTRPGVHPFHAAGLYYLQEPTAMAVVECADLAPGQTVLDIAAAPGGKATHASSAIGRSGLLLANEIHPARIKALGENLERWGAVNTIITNRTPEQLATIPDVSFQRIIIDAPCSGEGLFRREPDARREWSPARVTGSAARQSTILEAAVQMLAPGGALIYSTCTFNQEENETVVAALLAIHSHLRLDHSLRLWPHEVRGEGHTIHRLLDTRPPESHWIGYAPPPRTDSAAWNCFAAEMFTTDPVADWGGIVTSRNGRFMLEPLHPLVVSAKPAVRTGLWLGDEKPGRFEPSHALALALDPSQVTNRHDLTISEAHHWLAGEPIAANGVSGWVLITVLGYPLGWGKRSAGTIKNHYPKGLRRPLPVS